MHSAYPTATELMCLDTTAVKGGPLDGGSRAHRPDVSDFRVSILQIWTFARCGTFVCSALPVLSG
jgi:hypothetical protein